MCSFCLNLIQSDYEEKKYLISVYKHIKLIRTKKCNISRKRPELLESEINLKLKLNELRTKHSTNQSICALQRSANHIQAIINKQSHQDNNSKWMDEVNKTNFTLKIIKSPPVLQSENLKSRLILILWRFVL